MSAPHADRDRSEQPTPSTATAGSDPTQGASRSVSARVVRASEAQVEAARLAWHRQARAVADAVVAAGPDADEVTRLRAEVDRWRREAADAYEDGYDQGHADAHADGASEDRVCRANARADRLAEVVARVRSKAVAYRKACNDDLNRRWNDTDHGGRLACDYVLQEIEAAVSGPTPAETPQNGPEPALSREQGTSGQSGEGEALRGAEKGEWRAGCVVPGCEWFSLPYKAREGADKAGYNHWLSKGHGSTIRGRR